VVSPVAKQVVVVVHEMSVTSATVAGKGFVAHVEPPSEVTKTAGPVATSPATKHSDTPGHEIPVRSTAVAGTARVVQVAPASVDSRTTGTAASWDAAAKQVPAAGHETPENVTPVGAGFSVHADAEADPIDAPTRTAPLARAATAHRRMRPRDDRTQRVQRVAPFVALPTNLSSAGDEASRRPLTVGNPEPGRRRQS
jgi:hypothetical protein